MPLPKQSIGRPDSPIIPADWSAAPRLIIPSSWDATCTISRPGGARTGPLNPATGKYPTTPYPPHHTGACRVQALTGDDQQKTTAEEPVTTINYLIVVDLNAGTPETPLAVDDLVTITAVDDNGDPLMVGRTFTVTGVARGSLAWERDLTCIVQMHPNET